MPDTSDDRMMCLQCVLPAQSYAGKVETDVGKRTYKHTRVCKASFFQIAYQDGFEADYWALHRSESNQVAEGVRREVNSLKAFTRMITLFGHRRNS